MSLLPRPPARALALAFLFTVLACALMPAGADSIGSGQYQAFNVAFSERYLIPRYRRLAESTAALAGELDRFCAPDSDRASLDRARRAFHGVADAWAGVQHVTFGPVALLFRAERVNHWPERRNAVQRGLNEILKARDRQALEPVRFGKSSVAVQGLPALERLLFGDDAPALYRAGDEAAGYRCALTRAIGHNLATIGREVLSEWQDDMLADLRTKLDNPIFYSRPRDVTRQYFTDLLALLSLVGSVKLQPVLGRSIEEARPGRAEQYRSGRAARDIVLNLESAREHYGAGETPDGYAWFVRQGQGGAAADQTLRQDFDRAIALARALPGPLGEAAADPARRPAVEKTLAAVDALRQALEDTVPEAAGIATGFNSLDGD